MASAAPAGSPQNLPSPRGQHGCAARAEQGSSPQQELLCPKAHHVLHASTHIPLPFSTWFRPRAAPADPGTQGSPHTSTHPFLLSPRATQAPTLPSTAPPNHGSQPHLDPSSSLPDSPLKEKQRATLHGSQCGGADVGDEPPEQWVGASPALHEPHSFLVHRPIFISKAGAQQAPPVPGLSSQPQQLLGRRASQPDCTVPFKGRNDEKAACEKRKAILSAPVQPKDERKERTGRNLNTFLMQTIQSSGQKRVSLRYEQSRSTNSKTPQPQVLLPQRALWGRF